MERLRKREYGRYGDEIFTHPEKAQKYQEFMEWAKDYDYNTGIATRTLKAHLEWLSEMNIPFIEISGDYELQQKMDMVLDAINRKSEK